jgi:hypothetical protein
MFKWFSFSVLFLIFSCGKPLPSLEGIDLGKWKEDKNGCNSFRGASRETLDKQKEKLLALDEMQIVELLGRPDQNELSTRNQKFFYYFLAPSEACPGDHQAHPERLIIRFNALGLAKEVMIESLVTGH